MSIFSQTRETVLLICNICNKYVTIQCHICSVQFCLKLPHFISTVLTQCTGCTYFLSKVWPSTVLHSLTFLNSLFFSVCSYLDSFTVQACNCSLSDGLVVSYTK